MSQRRRLQVSWTAYSTVKWIDCAELFVMYLQFPENFLLLSRRQRLHHSKLYCLEMLHVSFAWGSFYSHYRNDYTDCCCEASCDFADCADCCCVTFCDVAELLLLVLWLPTVLIVNCCMSLLLDTLGSFYSLCRNDCTDCWTVCCEAFCDVVDRADCCCVTFCDVAELLLLWLWILIVLMVNAATYCDVWLWMLTVLIVDASHGRWTVEPPPLPIPKCSHASVLI